MILLDPYIYTMIFLKLLSYYIIDIDYFIELVQVGIREKYI